MYSHFFKVDNVNKITFSSFTLQKTQNFFFSLIIILIEKYASYAFEARVATEKKHTFFRTTDGK